MRARPRPGRINSLAAQDGNNRAPVAGTDARATRVVHDTKNAPAGFSGHSDEESNLLWADRVLLLPRPEQIAFLETVTKLSRDATEAWALVVELEEEIARLRPPPSRADRLRARDEAIREAARYYSDRPKTRIAEDLTRDLARYATSSWPRLETNATAHRRALHRILELCDGHALSERRIFDIL